MTRAQVEARRDALKAQHQQAVANVHALAGGLHECDYWLSLMADDQPLSSPLTLVPAPPVEQAG